MLCYRCGTHVQDVASKCPTCGQNLAAGGLRQATGTFSRRRAMTTQVEGAPFGAQELVAGRYLVKDVVGAGPLGYVFRAHDKEVDVEVALKVINPNLIQSAEERRHFADRMKQARSLSHPNIARVFDDGEYLDRPFVTTQFLDGLSLRKIIDLRLQKGQFFSLHEVEPILSQICTALDGAHKVGPHSDLRPDNVLVLPDLLKLTDFGLGLAIPRLPFVQAMRARRGDRYLAPELIDEREVDSRIDIYSVGVILGEMLSGLTPDGSIPEIGRRNPQIPSAIEGLYRKALSSSPSTRFQSAIHLLEELRDIASKNAPKPISTEAAEPAIGVAAPNRPRASTGMLQLQPRRERSAPPVSDLPPTAPPLGHPPPPPDATQQVDQSVLEVALRKSVESLDASLDAKADSEETVAIDSSGLAARIDSIRLDEDAPAQSSRRLRQYVLLVGLLIVAGIAFGAGGALLFLEREQSPAPVENRHMKSLLDAGIHPLAAAPTTPEVSDAPVDKVDAGTETVDPKKVAVGVSSAASRVKCGEDMRLVAAGAFMMGTGAGDPMTGFDEKPLTQVELGAYCIDTFEYPNQRGDQPMAAVSYGDAAALCAKTGKRLCKESEWEKACKGAKANRWPYGNEYDVSACNSESEGGDARKIAASGQFAQCRSAYGVFDLSGNLGEWTADQQIKGGSFASGDYAVRCSARKSGASASKSSEVGFRCCSDLK